MVICNNENANRLASIRGVGVHSNIRGESTVVAQEQALGKRTVLRIGKGREKSNLVLLTY